MALETSRGSNDKGLLSCCNFSLKNSPPSAQVDLEVLAPRAGAQTDKVMSFWEGLSQEEQTEIMTVELDELCQKVLHLTAAEKSKLLGEWLYTVASRTMWFFGCKNTSEVAK